METGSGPPPERGLSEPGDELTRVGSGAGDPRRGAAASPAASVGPAGLPGWARPVAALEAEEVVSTADTGGSAGDGDELSSPRAVRVPTVRADGPQERSRQVAPPPSRPLADHALRAFLVPLALVVVTAVAAVGLAGAARDAQQRSVDHAGVADNELAIESEVDRLWSAVLAVVAGGVGQRTVTADELAAQIGAVRRASDSGRLDGSPPASADATRERSRFTESVSSVVERSDGDPVEIGNELTSLEASYRAASNASQQLRQVQRSLADDAAERSDQLWWASLAVLLIGLLATAVTAVAAKRRLSGDLDGAVSDLRDAALSLGASSPGPGSAEPSRRDATLADVGSALDVAATAIGRDRLALEHRAEWGEHSRMIAEALDLADDESGACEVVAQSFPLIDPSMPAELLLGERSGNDLHEVAVSPEVGSPGCPVQTTGACVAIRRGQVSVFESSEAINACPKLRGRPEGAISAVCVPVAVKGRAVGVLHVTGAVDDPPPPQIADRLNALSALVGTRFTSLRTLEHSRQEASTDQLTGLPNRRTLESEVASLLGAGTPFVMVLADLDKFKRLNDSFGHEIGDRALQLFSGVLRDNVRGNDVVSRLGGEEFVLVYPNMSVAISIEAIGRLRAALARAITDSRLPSFTCSFGVTHSSVGGDGDAILRIADAGLLRAKALGGDQAVFADRDLAATIFEESDSSEAQDPSEGERGIGR